MVRALVLLLVLALAGPAAAQDAAPPIAPADVLALKVKHLERRVVERDAELAYLRASVALRAEMERVAKASGLNLDDWDADLDRGVWVRKKK